MVAILSRPQCVYFIFNALYDFSHIWPTTSCIIPSVEPLVVCIWAMLCVPFRCPANGRNVDTQLAITPPHTIYSAGTPSGWVIGTWWETVAVSHVASEVFICATADANKTKKHLRWNEALCYSSLFHSKCVKSQMKEKMFTNIGI